MLMFWFCVALAQCGLLWLLARCGRSLVRKAGEEREANRFTPPGGWPRAAMIIPVAGAHPRMVEALSSLLRQDYPDLLPVLVTATAEEPAAGLIRTLREDFPALRHVVAGPAAGCGQKNHNSLQGVAAVGDAGSVLNISESAENITSSYIDVQARLSALETQRDRLNALADQAETTADLLEIESQLSDVQYQLENYTRQLRSMDQQVSYSTVDIYLREVATLTPTGVTFGERIADAFGGGWDAFVGFLQGLVIALVYLWPVLLIAVAVVFILRKVWKKRPKKEKLPKPAQTPPPAEYPVKPGDEPKPKY